MGEEVTNLDDKLREMLLEGAITFNGGKKRIFWSNDGIVAQIKQAFADEGWAEKRLENKPRHFEQFVSASKKLKNYPEGTMMTSKEWYERFEKELEALFKRAKKAKATDIDQYDVLEAAKRAAGVKE